MTGHCPSTHQHTPCSRRTGHTGLHLHGDTTGYITYWTDHTADKKATA